MPDLAAIAVLTMQGVVHNTKFSAPTVSVTHLSSRQFEAKFPGFAEWRLKHKGVPVSQTLDELNSNKNQGGSSRKRLRQQHQQQNEGQLPIGSSSSSSGGHVAATRRKAAAAGGGKGSKRVARGGKRFRQRQLQHSDDEDWVEEWLSGSGSDCEDLVNLRDMVTDLDMRGSGVQGMTTTHENKTLIGSNRVAIGGLSDVEQGLRVGLGCTSGLSGRVSVCDVGSAGHRDSGTGVRHGGDSNDLAAVAAVRASETALDSISDTSASRGVAAVAALKQQQQQRVVMGCSQHAVPERSRRQPPRGKSRHKDLLLEDQEQDLLLRQLEHEDLLLFEQWQQQLVNGDGDLLQQQQQQHGDADLGQRPQNQQLDVVGQQQQQQQQLHQQDATVK